MRRHRAAICAAWVAAAGLAGCQQKTGLQEWIQQTFLPPPPTTMVAMAFDPNDPDRRREGINLLSDEDWGLREPYLKGYAELLRSDADPSVRGAAARALGKAGDPNYVKDLAEALERPDEVEAVRWDCAVALDSVIGPAAVRPLMAHARHDAAVDVRVNCARALRHYPRQDAARTLVMCLSDRSFTVRHEARASLVALTGEDHGYAAEKWAAAVDEGIPPTPPDRRKRPWWDWFGVTDGR
jgi:hypothetical protein